MTTNTQHKNNGDTAQHANKAVEAVARKYYVQVEGFSLEEAKAKVQKLVKANMLQTAEYYNSAIVKDTAAKANVERRESARKEREEQNEKARQEHEAQQKAKEAKENTVDAESVQFVNNMINEGNTIPQIKGYLQYKGYSSKVIKAFLGILDLKKAKTRVESGMQAFMNSFIDRPMSENDFYVYIKAGSDNIKRHESLYRNMFNAFNAIHARYDVTN